MLRIFSIAFIATTAIQIIRAWFPLLYSFAEKIGFQNIPIFLLLICCLPIAGLFFKRFHHYGLIIVGTYIAILRILIQLLPMNFGIMFISIAIFIILIPIFLIHIRNTAPNQLLYGLLLGMGIDTTLQAFYHTWDYIWQQNLLATTIAIITSITTLYCVWKDAANSKEQHIRVASWWFAPYLAIQTILLHNIAFIAASSQISIFAASKIILCADILAICALHFFSHKAILKIPLIAITLCGLHYLLSEQFVTIFIIVTQITVNLLLFLYLPLGAKSTMTTMQICIRVLVISMLYAIIVLLFQMHYERPLSFNNSWLIIMPITLLIFFPIKKNVTIEKVTYFKVPIILIVCIFIVFGVDYSQPKEKSETSINHQFKMACYNVHSAVNKKGMLNPEAIAKIIEENDVQVVLLQEVGRGWPISGMIDLAHWLKHRLRMKLVYGPAASAQFGNAILTNLPISESGHEFLPKGSGSMNRSYVYVKLRLGKDKYVYVVNTHLQHKKKNTQLRIRQINSLLQRWSGKPSTIIAGDLNARPNSKEMKLFFKQKKASNKNYTLSKNKKIRENIDWILGSDDITFLNFYIIESDASDHFPLFSTIQIRDISKRIGTK